MNTLTNNLLMYLKQKNIDFFSLSSEKKCALIAKITTNCKYCSSSHPISPILNPESKVLFVGRSPSKYEIRANSLLCFSQDNSFAWNSFLSLLELPLSEVSITNSCNCPTNQYNDKVLTCEGYLPLEVNALPKLKVIYLACSTAMRHFLPNQAFTLEASLGNVYTVERSQIDPFSEDKSLIRLIPIFHPHYVALKPDYRDMVQSILLDSRQFLV